MIALRVLHAGLLTTVQDLGRPRCRRWGVPPSGAADPYSARLANTRAGNPEGAALLEMTASGARFEVVKGIRVAVAGADMPVLRNGSVFDSGSSGQLVAGDVLEFGAARAGFRTYLAIAGGVDVPEILGSRSTHLSAGFGGWKGRRLEKDDAIAVLEGPAARPRVLESFSLPTSPAELRVISGPQRESFPPEAVRRFFEAEFRVSSRSNRMGLRLEGERFPAVGAGVGGSAALSEMAPEGSVAGAVQIPPGGEPIVHMPEGPVTGGYARIAGVISADLGIAGQLRPGGVVRFREVTLEEALRARREREMILEGSAE